jgi:hypothetical protein
MMVGTPCFDGRQAELKWKRGPYIEAYRFVQLKMRGEKHEDDLFRFGLCRHLFGSHQLRKRTRNKHDFELGSGCHIQAMLRCKQKYYSRKGRNYRWRSSVAQDH